MQVEIFQSFGLSEYPAYCDERFIGAQLLQRTARKKGEGFFDTYVAWAGVATFNDERNMHINPLVLPGTSLYLAAERWCRDLLERLGIQTFQLIEHEKTTQTGVRASLYVQDMVSSRPTWSNRFIGFFRAETDVQGSVEINSQIIRREDVTLEAVFAAETWMGKRSAQWA